jgi:CysZ protein
MSNPVAGANYLLRGLGLLLKPGIRAYVIIPLLINCLLFILFIALSSQQFNGLMHWLMPELPDWLQWLSWLLWLLFGIAVALILFFTFSLVCNLVGAPFNGLLAEAVEHYLTGSKPETAPSSMRKLVADIVPAVLNELKKILFFLLWSIPFLVLFFIPVINIVAPILWFLFSAWMLALEYTDYPMANHELLFNEQRKRLRNQSLRTLGFGGIVSFATMIPIANFIVMPAAVAGATIYWVEQLAGTRRP